LRKNIPQKSLGKIAFGKAFFEKEKNLGKNFFSVH